MAQDIELLNALYLQVPTVMLPKSGGGMAAFTDVSPTTAVSADVAQGKKFYLSDGTEAVGTASGGGGSATKKQINFIDYDGTLLHSFTKDEINAMTSASDLPANPSHTGLTAQGWNWTLAQIKAQLTAVPEGDIWVGQMYITASGKTEIDVSMLDGRLSPTMTIAVKGTITVDWGDNTTPNTVTGTSLTSRKAVPHTYASAGDYTITISVTSGSFSFYGSSSYTLLRKNTTSNENRVYTNCIQNIRLGTGITSIDSYAFAYCYSLTSITMPSGITFINSNTFNYCYSLASITIPSTVTSFGTSVFNYCGSLVNVAIPSGITVIGNYMFNYCYSLTSITIPSTVTSIGDGAFNSCSALASITIPNGVTSIGNSAFNYCYPLTSITIPNSVTSIGNSAFNSCYSLVSVTIPSKVTSIGSSVFNYCYSLASITISSNVTSIGNSAFNSCYSLVSVTIPSKVTSIGSSVFKDCYGVFEYHLLSTTPPTLDVDAFKNIVSDCIIYVPYSADHSILEAYQTATNWSSYTSKMQEEPQ